MQAEGGKDEDDKNLRAKWQVVTTMGTHQVERRQSTKIKGRRSVKA